MKKLIFIFSICTCFLLSCTTLPPTDDFESPAQIELGEIKAQLNMLDSHMATMDKLEVDGKRARLNARKQQLESEPQISQY